MKVLVWGVAIVLAAMWSAGIAVLASVSDWLASSAGQALGGARDLSSLALPAWLDVWIAPAWRESLFALIAATQDALAWVTPWIGPLLEWIAPLLWVLWGFGMLMLLAAAAGSQFLIGKLMPARAA